MIALIDYGMGNIRSVEKALESLGCGVKVTNKPEDIKKAKGVILPGVGAFYDCITELKRKKLDFAIKQAIEDKKPYLGLCLGMQILFDRSFEGGVHLGLSIFKGTVNRLPEDVKVPHMGWNKIEIKSTFPLFKGINKPLYAYFVHSFYAEAEKEDVITTTDYGINFCSGVGNDYVFGLQFHPEKSGDQGLKILNNFAELVG